MSGVGGSSRVYPHVKSSMETAVWSPCFLGIDGFRLSSQTSFLRSRTPFLFLGKWEGSSTGQRLLAPPASGLWEDVKCPSVSLDSEVPARQRQGQLAGEDIRNCNESRWMSGFRRAANMKATVGQPRAKVMAERA